MKECKRQTGAAVFRIQILRDYGMRDNVIFGVGKCGEGWRVRFTIIGGTRVYSDVFNAPSLRAAFVGIRRVYEAGGGFKKRPEWIRELLKRAPNERELYT